MREPPEGIAKLSPEQETKMLLLDLLIMDSPDQGYWIWDRVNHKLLIAVDGSDGGTAKHYWPTIDEAIIVATNPAKHGLKWKT